MTHGTPPLPDAVPDETLEALAAGELSAEKVRLLRAAAARDTALAARVAAAEHLEALLTSEELLPVPLSLLARVREAVRTEPRTGYESGDLASSDATVAAWAPMGRGRRILRAMAAAVLVALGAALTFGGIEPVSAAADTLRSVGLEPPAPIAGLPTVSESLARVGAPQGDLWLVRPDVEALAQVPEDVPGGPSAVLGGAAALFALGLGFAWRSRLATASRGARATTLDGRIS